MPLSTRLTLVTSNRTTQMSSASSGEPTVLERKTQHVSDEQSAVDTLPEGLPLPASDHDLIIDIVSALSGEQPGEDDLANLPTGEGATIDEASLPTRKPFDEEPTRKKHAPKPPPRELTDVSDVHELFKDWNNN